MVYNPTRDVTSRVSIGHTNEEALSPRESAASTSLSIWKSSGKVISKLRLACRYLKPVVDEVVSAATSYSHEEFRHILKTRSPICSISTDQYCQACRASEIYEEVSEVSEVSAYPTPQVIVNAFHGCKKASKQTGDKVYVDQDFMKQLVDLHEVILETIKKMKSSTSKRSITPRLDESVPTDIDTPRVLPEGPPKGSQDDFEHDFIIIDFPDQGIADAKKSSTKGVAKDRPPKTSPPPEGDCRYCSCPLCHTSNEAKANKAKGKKNLTLPKANGAVDSPCPLCVANEGKADEVRADTPQFNGEPLERRESSKVVEMERRVTIDPSLGAVAEVVALAPTVSDLYIAAEGRDDEEVTTSTPAKARSDDSMWSTNSKKSSHRRSDLVTDLTEAEHLGAETELWESNLRPEPDHYPRQPEGPQQCVEVSPKLQPEETKSKPKTDDWKLTSLVATGSNQGELVRCQEELDKLTKMYAELSMAVDSLRNGRLGADTRITKGASVKQSDPLAVNLVKARDSGKVSSRTQRKILNCIAELTQIKDLLAVADKPQLTVDKSPGECKSGSCPLGKVPHVHATLNGIPVTVKLDQSTVDVLLAEKDPFRKRRLCECDPGKDPKSRRLNPLLMESTMGSDRPSSRKPSARSQRGQGMSVNPKALIIKEETLTRMCKIPYIRTLKLEERESMTYRGEYVRRSLSGQRSLVSRRSLEGQRGLEPLNENIVNAALTGKKPVQKYRIRQSITSDSTTSDDETDEFDESLASLPYQVHRKSLPNVNICPPMSVTISELKTNIRSEEVSHPNQRIMKQLKAVGVDNLIRASIPAECCRRAVINEMELEDEPFHASINSLPLTTSDLQLIGEVIGGEGQRMHILQTCKLAYYTNFQENLASNIDRYMPTRAYEVRFFQIFKRTGPDQKATRTSLGERLSGFLRRVIFNEAAPSQTEGAKVVHNKRCQTEDPRKVRDPMRETRPSRAIGSASRAKGVPSRSRRVQCRPRDTAEQVNPSQPQESRKAKAKHSGSSKDAAKLETSSDITTSFKSNQAVYTCATNMGTIYEGEEKGGAKDKNLESLYNFMRSPDLTPSFQKFITSDVVEAFWGLYFATKRGPRGGGNGGPPLDVSDVVSTVSQKKLLIASTRKRASRIPKRVPKHSCSASSSESSTCHRPKRLRVRSHTDFEDDNKDCGLGVCDGKAVTCDEKVDDLGASVEVLPALRSRNDPGYVSVLHPVCGCPEVSIFIPCYCEGQAPSSRCWGGLSQEALRRLVRSEGRHVILSKTCRVERSCHKDTVEDS